MKILAIIILMVGSLQAQQSYELTPGVKGNQIVLQLSNVSKSLSAENVEVKLIRQSANLKFTTAEAKISNLNKSEEKEASFSFDVNYNAEITKTDTIEFLITNQKSIQQKKQFIFTYTQPKEFRLEQNYPNPFNPVTKIRYSVPSNVTLRQAQSDNHVTLKIYDILGNEVATLVNEGKQPGYYEVEFNANNMASGVYIYRLTSGNPSASSGQRFVSTKKMMVLR